MGICLGKLNDHEKYDNIIEYYNVNKLSQLNQLDLQLPQLIIGQLRPINHNELEYIINPCNNERCLYYCINCDEFMGFNDSNESLWINRFTDYSSCNLILADQASDNYINISNENIKVIGLDKIGEYNYKHSNNSISLPTFLIDLCNKYNFKLTDVYEINKTLRFTIYQINSGDTVVVLSKINHTNNHYTSIPIKINLSNDHNNYNMFQLVKSFGSDNNNNVIISCDIKHFQNQTVSDSTSVSRIYSNDNDSISDDIVIPQAYSVRTNNLIYSNSAVPIEGEVYIGTIETVYI